MRERILAVLGAVALVAVAVLVRSWLSGDGDSEAGGSGSRPDGERPVVACTPDLAEVCERLADAGQIATDPPSLDLSDASEPPAEVDGWVTWGPAAEVASFDADPSGATGPWTTVEVIGTAELAALAEPGARRALTDACASVGWACLAAEASPSLSVGVGSPDDAEGLARIAPLARVLTVDDDYRELDTASLRDLLDSPPVPQEPAPAMAAELVRAPGSVSVVVGPRPLLAAQADTAQGRARDLALIDLDPGAEVTVVVAQRRGADLRSVDGWCRDAEEPLTRAGLAACPNVEHDADLAGFLYQVRKELR